MTPLAQHDEEAMIAAVDLVGRSGAKQFEFGYLDDVPRAEDARWWASANYRGAKLIVENHRSPIAAAEALARRVLAGGRCAHCDRIVQIGEPWDTPSPFRMGHRPRRCVWTRRGPRWEMGCTPKGATR